VLAIEKSSQFQQPRPNRNFASIRGKSLLHTKVAEAHTNRPSPHTNELQARINLPILHTISAVLHKPTGEKVKKYLSSAGLRAVCLKNRLFSYRLLLLGPNKKSHFQKEAALPVC